MLTYQPKTGAPIGRHPTTRAPIFAPTTPIVFSAYLEDDADAVSRGIGNGEFDMELQGRLLSPKQFPPEIRSGTDLVCVLESATAGQVTGVLTLTSAAKSPFGLESVFGAWIVGKFKESRA